MQELKDTNKLLSNSLAIGQILIIPDDNDKNESEYYTVVSGDTLYQISRKFNISVDELKRINNLTSNNLSIGQKLLIKIPTLPNVDEEIYSYSK